MYYNIHLPAILYPVAWYHIAATRRPAPLPQTAAVPRSQLPCAVAPV